jgi:hypothetical protein
VKLSHRHPIPTERKAQLAAEFGVEEVFFAKEPFWYTRLTARFRLTWRRELASVATVLVLGLALGFLLGHSLGGRAEPAEN